MKVSPARFLFHPVDRDEHEIVSVQKRKGKKSKINDRRTFREEEILINEDALPVFKRGLINFFIGAIILRESGKKHYAYVIHTATQKGSHSSLKSVAETLLNPIKKRDNTTIPKIEKLLVTSLMTLSDPYSLMVSKCWHTILYAQSFLKL